MKESAMCMKSIFLLLLVAFCHENASCFPQSNGENGLKNFTLEEALFMQSALKYFNGSWLNDYEILYRDEDGNSRIYDVEKRLSRDILGEVNLEKLVKSCLEDRIHGLENLMKNLFQTAIEPFSQSWISNDRKYLLLLSNISKVYRYSYLADYDVLDLETGTMNKVGPGNSNRLQLVSGAPKGNALVYVHENNIYYRPQSNVSQDFQITYSGIPNVVYNGVADWVYEEEIFSASKALWFSPDGKKLIFAQFNDSRTREIEIPYYGAPGNIDYQYPTYKHIHYPKSGTPNPTVKLFLVDLEKLFQGREGVLEVEIEGPESLAPANKILTAVSFVANELVSVTWTNRVQNLMFVQLCNVSRNEPNCSEVFTYHQPNGWIESISYPKISNDGTKMLHILPQEQKNGRYWKHLLLSKNSENRILTSGSFEVKKIVSWDQKRNIVYYLATTEDSPNKQHLYRIFLKTGESECMSCNFRTELNNTECSYCTAQFSTDNSNFAFSCLGPDVPETVICTRNRTNCTTWKTNKFIAREISKKNRPMVKNLTIPIFRGFEARARLLIPPNADLSGSTKYPMLVYVYAGPGSSSITDMFEIDWGMYLATNKSIIYAKIDARGAGNRGNDMLFSVYRNLGKLEIFDQLNITRFLQNEYDFIDKNKTGIWGWSYGGYATAMALAKDTEGIFKCGISGAPVTDWALYDTMYTERYMDLPLSNWEGYVNAQVFRNVRNFRNKNFYLIHGTMDDNVHYQQSLFLAKVLEKKDVLFQQQTYTDETHGITNMHLYHSLENFLFKKCFD